MYFTCDAEDNFFSTPLQGVLRQQEWLESILMRSTVRVGRICSCVPTYLASCALRIFDSARKRKWKWEGGRERKRRWLIRDWKEKNRRKIEQWNARGVFLFYGEIGQHSDLWPRLFDCDRERTGTFTMFWRLICLQLIGLSVDNCAGCVSQITSTKFRRDL